MNVLDMIQEWAEALYPDNVDEQEAFFDGAAKALAMTIDMDV